MAKERFREIRTGEVIKVSAAERDGRGGRCLGHDGDCPTESWTPHKSERCGVCRSFVCEKCGMTTTPNEYFHRKPKLCPKCTKVKLRG